MNIRPERVDHLGRVIPSLKLADVLRDIAAGVTSRELAGILAVCEGPAHKIVRDAAIAAGHTHYPPDLAGHASPL